MAAQDNHIEQAILIVGLGKNFQRTTVAFAISHQHHGALHGITLGRADGEERGLFAEELGGGNDIAQRAERLFALPGCFPDDLRVNAHSRELHEGMAI